MDFYHLVAFQGQINLNNNKMIDKKIKNFIKSQSIKDYPNETCGFIVRKNEKFICLPCKNISKTPKDNFHINSTEFLKIKNIYNNIYYIYHSHVENENDYFSDQDKTCAENLNIPIILYHLKKNLFKIYSPLEISKNYIGRFYEYKKYDCFTLIKDFYKNEKNINLNIDYSENLNEINVKEKILSYYNINNLKIVDSKEKLMLHDILFLYGQGTKHLALYLGEDKILHQPMFGFSKIENYCNFYKRHTDLILRYNQ